MSRSSQSSNSSNTHNRQGSRTPPPSGRASQRSSNWPRDSQKSQKPGTKGGAVDRVDILQILEPQDGDSLFHTNVINKFLNEHLRSRNIAQFKITHKEIDPHRFQVAIKHRFPRTTIMADVQIIFTGTIAGKTPYPSINSHLTWKQWHDLDRKIRGGKIITL